MFDVQLAYINFWLLSVWATLPSGRNFCLTTQLSFCQRAPGHYGVFIISDSSYRGTAARGVNSGSAYYDLLRMGYKSLYISLRVLASVLAYNELQPTLAPPSKGIGASLAFDRTKMSD